MAWINVDVISSRLVMERNASVTEQQSEQQWDCCYQKLPRAQFAFFAQVIIIYIVIIAAIINISLDTPEKTYWLYILGSVTGILFPSPSLKKPKLLSTTLSTSLLTKSQGSIA